MGQRLVITLEQNDKAVAAIYYHWSAYTYSALQETKRVIDCIYNKENETLDRMLLRLIHHLEDNGGGIRGSDEEFEYIKSLYPNAEFKTEGYSRNDGIIALSQQGMTDLRSWSEGDVYINLDTDQVDFCVYSGYESLEEYLEESKEWDDEFDANEFKHIPKYDICLGYFDVNEIDDVLCVVEHTNSHIIQCNGEVCELIE
jgi:hypothetical protein